MTQRIELFCIRLKELKLLKELNFFIWIKELNHFFFSIYSKTQRIELYLVSIEQYDSQNWTLFLWIWPKNWTLFLEYDAKNWTLYFLNMTQCIEQLNFLNMTQRIGPFFQIWLQEMIFFFKKIMTHRIDVLTLTDRIELFEKNLTHRIELF